MSPSASSLPTPDFNAAIGEDLILTLALKSEATINLNREGCQNCLTIINHGPKGCFNIERNGNLVTLNQKSPDDVGNSKVEILVPHHFRWMNLVLSDDANVTSIATPLATTITSTDDVMAEIHTCDCLANLDGRMAINIHMMESQKQNGGEVISTRHNLFMMSRGEGAHDVHGLIDNAYFLVEGASSIRVLANAISNVHAYGAKTYFGFEHEILLLSAPVSGERKIRGVNPQRLNRKREQMTRYFNACVLKKALMLE